MKIPDSPTIQRYFIGTSKAIAGSVAIALILIATSPLNTWASDQKSLNTKKQKKSHKTVAQGTSYAIRADVLEAAVDIAQQQDLDLKWVRHTLAQAHYIPSIAKAVLPPAVGVPKNWAAYRSRFIEPRRIQAGVDFWRTHHEALMRAEQETGVPAELIVGVIGVETIYGQQTGNFRVLDALATLAFDFPDGHPRAAERRLFFKQELAQFLTLSKRNGRDPLTMRGSYAGAMGLPQFMPSSWLKYAVDFDGDGRVDLLGSPTDAIGSVANYFKVFNWQPGLATHFPLNFDENTLDLDGLLLPDILPTFSVSSFQAKGVVLAGDALNHVGNLALIELQMGDAPPIYLAGTDNFYAITRYNWSSYYALAVIELGEAVKLALAATP
jgi:membrane-bound lytic murein transglycosylase B